MTMHYQAADAELYVVHKDGADQQAHVLERRESQVYVHYVNVDKRMDEWVSADAVRPAGHHEAAMAGNANGSGSTAGRKRKRRASTRELAQSDTQRLPDTDAEAKADSLPGTADTPGPLLTEEEYDIEQHKQITARRNFDKVIFGRWQIKTWYFSPYPLTEMEADDQVATPSSHGPASVGRIPGVSRSTFRGHGRTSDLLAGGLGRSHGIEKAMLWVCDRCFKYMSEGVSWEIHIKKCQKRHPPGRKVYQRGAHIIWEVDGAKEKLFCQNLSLFGKLFIDIKTLFFDCDNFLFYILTDADSQRDHVLGFFSKEKVSFDDYNLACIVVLPPYQKKGYGMLLIEFSYELSRRSGRVGTPERPLSDLGLRSYLTYWTSTIIRFLRRLLAVLPPDASKMVTVGGLPDFSDTHTIVYDDARRTKRRKSTKGWDGEESPAARTPQTPDEADTIFAALRTVETMPNADGSATAHVLVRCSLADLARATNLRLEDAAFALSECGLLERRHEGSEDGLIVISREMVEAVARERNVKRMCMELQCVLL